MNDHIGQEDFDRDKRIYERGRLAAAMTRPVRSERIEWLLAIVADELRHATEKFASFNSPHEGKAVIEEELDELWEHVKGNTGDSADAMREAVQVAAMAMRYVHDLATTMGPASTTTAEPSPSPGSPYGHDPFARGDLKPSRPVSTDEEEGQGLEDGGLQSRPSGGESE